MISPSNWSTCLGCWLRRFTDSAVQHNEVIAHHEAPIPLSGPLLSSLYATASEGGTIGVGTLFKIHPDGSGFVKL